MKDFLIKPQDVIKHCTLLNKHHPGIAKVKLFEGFGHIDFTYANHHIIVDAVMKAIENSFNDDKHQANS